MLCQNTDIRQWQEAWPIGEFRHRNKENRHTFLEARHL